MDALVAAERRGTTTSAFWCPVTSPTAPAPWTAATCSASLAWYGEALRLDRGDSAAEDAHRVRLAGVLRRCPRLIQAWFDNGAAPPAFSPDGRRVLLIHRDAARTWDVAGGEAVSAPMKHAADVERAAFSPDGGRVVTTAADGTARCGTPAAASRSPRRSATTS